MAEPAFLAIADELQRRVESIAPPEFHTDLSQAVYLEGLQPVPVDDVDGMPLPGSVVIDPGSIEIPEDAESRAGKGVLLEALFDRTVRIICALPIADKSAWLDTAERVGMDLREAIGKQPANMNDDSVTDWRRLGVRSIVQSGQQSTRPEAGSRTQYIETSFRIRYVET